MCNWSSSIYLHSNQRNPFCDDVGYNIYFSNYINTKCLSGTSILPMRDRPSIKVTIGECQNNVKQTM